MDLFLIFFLWNDCFYEEGLLISSWIRYNIGIQENLWPGSLDLTEHTK